MWKNWVNFGLGIFMVVSPWYIRGLSLPQQPEIAYNCVITGGLIAGFSTWGLVARGQLWSDWTVLFLGLWLVIAPGTLSYQSSTMTWINVVVGLTMAALSAWRIRDKARGQERAPSRESRKEGRRLQDCPTSARLLYTAFLLLMGAGYLMALTYLYLTHQGLDGKPGLSVADIADSYYGNRSGTRLEAAIRGPMAGFIQPEERHDVIAWLHSGALEKDYVSRIRPILEKDCLKCHSPASGLKVPDFSTFQGVHELAKVDTGASILSLVKLSHIHLFGIGLVAVGLGFVFQMTTVRTWLKNLLLLLPFVVILVDISTWFVTKWDPIYAYTIVASGALLGLAWAAQILISLYQMWLLPLESKVTE
ncbi:MAG: SPW repeat protein [Acidiferrobacterales bacterium]